MMRFIDYCSKVLQGRPRSSSTRTGQTAVNDNVGANPLARMRTDCPPAPKWEDMRASVLLRASKLAHQEDIINRTAIIERAQFATAMALFIVIACCILGLLLPGSFSGETTLASNPDQPMEPVLASYQHP